MFSLGDKLNQPINISAEQIVRIATLASFLVK